MGKYSPEIQAAAKKLYLRRHKAKEIAELLDVPLRTVYDWKMRGNWEDLLATETLEDAYIRRLALLAEKEVKTKVDLDEIRTLTDSMVRIHNAKKREENRQDSGSVEHNNGKKRKVKRGPTRKNDVSMLTAADFAAKLHKHYFEYQMELRRAMGYRNRFLLKSRQIGATWYFAQEAFEDATLFGRNKIFLSATRAQAEVFRRYIIGIAREHFDIELKGNPIILHTAKGPAELHFLSNNSSSAQSYTGDVYIDEFFWIQKFNSLYKVATGMASHKKWRRTLFSTPSAVTHEAHDLWTGDRFNQRFKKKRVEFPGFKEMQSGIICPDKTWRKIITLDDAEAGGCDLFDRDDLIFEYSPSEFKNLFGCEFVNDTLGVFNFADLEECGVDTSQWTEIDNSEPRPVGNRSVWGGYDPSRHRDDASFVILLPSLEKGGKFKVIKRFKWINKSFVWQAEEIKKLTKKYRFDYIGVDVTGPGLGVFDTIKNFFPQATPIHYSPTSKTTMVLKAKEVIDANRIEWDAQETTIAHAFLTIREIMTGGGQMSYVADRTKTTGHADVAFAIMHALINEKLSHDQVAKATVEIY